MSLCLFKFDKNSEAIFYAGDVVSGEVKLLTTKRKFIRGIFISTIGYAKIRRMKGSHLIDEKTHFSDVDEADVEYLSSEVWVLGDKQGEIFPLESGVYRYKFEFSLPDKIPYSFDGVCGYVRYKITLTISRYRYRYNNIFEQPFWVYRHLDLSKDHWYKVPINLNTSKAFGFFCWITKPIKANVHLPLSGYAPGEKIPFTVTIQNVAQITCRKAKIRFLKVITYKYDTAIRDDIFVIDERIFGKIEKETKRVFNGSLNVPLIPPSSLRTCSVIEIWYCIQLLVYPTKFDKKYLDLTFPITIGTVPVTKTIIDSTKLKNSIKN